MGLTSRGNQGSQHGVEGMEDLDGVNGSLTLKMQATKKIKAYGSERQNCCYYQYKKKRHSGAHRQHTHNCFSLSTKGSVSENDQAFRPLPFTSASERPKGVRQAPGAGQTTFAAEVTRSTGQWVTNLHS